ncbi:MAG: hypothetical protein IE887_11245 [Campylobacterales bacterium]|nr:hypothetical protein [Campylobacterales bacterium]
MRTLNEFEKSIVGRISVYHNNGIVSNFASIIDHRLENIDIALDFTNRTVELKADIQFYNQGTLIDVVQQLTFELVTTVNLLKDLESNGYVTTFLQAQNAGQQRYGQLIQGNQSISYQFVDPDLVNLLLDYSFKSILVGQPLVDYVNNDFRTNEEVSQSRNLRIAVYSLVASVILSAIGLYFSNKGLEDKPVQLDKNSLKELTVPTENLNGQLDNIKQEIENSKSDIIEVIKQDTLKTIEIKKK